MKTPHLRGHILGSRPADVEVEVQAVAAVLVSCPRDPPAACYPMVLGNGQVTFAEDVASGDIPVGCFLDYSAPGAILIVGKVYSRGRTRTCGQLGGDSLHAAAPVVGVPPAVDYISDGLFFVGIAGTAEDVDASVIVVDGLLS